MIAKIIIFILVASVDSETHKTGINVMKTDSMFEEVNAQLQGIWDGIFTALKLEKNFTNKTKVDVMTTMTETLNNISEIHFKVYENIKNITAPDEIQCNNEKGNELFDINPVIEEIFVENDYFLRNNIFNPSRSLKEFYRALVGADATKIIIETDSTETMENSTVDDNVIEERNITYNETYKEHARHKKKQSKSYKINIDENIRFKIRNTKFGLRAWRLSNLTVELENLSRTRRIFKSIPARVKRYPFMASINVLGEFVCAGSIISKHLVLTAASCLQLANQDKQFLQRSGAVTVRVGSDYTDRGGELLSVVTTTFHPDYDSVFLKNNLVVMQLDKPLDFMKGMRRIEYERSDRDVGHDVTILGWGDKNNYNTYNGSLETARLQVCDLETCKRIYSLRYIDETNFCAGYVDVSGGACNRDIGGPALIGSTLLGIINFGPPICGTPNSPTVFTKLGHYVGWIDDVVLKTQATEPLPKLSLQRASRTLNSMDQSNQNKDSSNLLNSPLRVLTSLFKNLVSKGNIDLDSILYPGQNFDTNKVENNLNNNFYTIPPPLPSLPPPTDFMAPQYGNSFYPMKNMPERDSYSILPNVGGGYDNIITPPALEQLQQSDPQGPSFNRPEQNPQNNLPHMDPAYDKVITPPPLRQLQTNTQYPNFGMQYQTPTTTTGDDILKQIDKVRNFVEQHVLEGKMLRTNTENSITFMPFKITNPDIPVSRFSQIARKPTEAFFDVDLANDEDDTEDEKEYKKNNTSEELNIDFDDPKKTYLSEIDNSLEAQIIKTEHRHLKKKLNKRKKSKKHKHKKRHGNRKSRKVKKDPVTTMLDSSNEKDKAEDQDMVDNKHDSNLAHYNIDEDDDDTWDVGLNRRSILDYINI